MTPQTQTRIEPEIAALRRFGTCHITGIRMMSYAFGAYLPIEGNGFMPVDEARDYLFTIYAKGDTLELYIDRYTATHGHAYSSDEFDDDAWSDGHLVLETSLNRPGFATMHRIARGLLSGRNLVLSNGEVIEGCRPKF